LSAAHGPYQVTKDWADKCKSKFDDGWDAYRERVFKRANEWGWIPQLGQLTPRPATLPSWDSISEAEKPFQRRLMGVWQASPSTPTTARASDVRGLPRSTLQSLPCAW
jgi:arylsulfatase A-like enzyme